MPAIVHKSNYCETCCMTGYDGFFRINLLREARLCRCSLQLRALHLGVLILP
jgi:hypothetical protein